MRNFIGVMMTFLVYIIVYYRLLVKHDYQTEQNKKETAFCAIITFPSHKFLFEDGKQYAIKYWTVLSIMISCVVNLAISSKYQVV
jgi:Na+/H+ antiporter NhaC